MAKKITILGFLLLVSFSVSFAVVPTKINFQGVLKDSAGNPVTNSSLSMVFSIYDTATGGTPLWTETQTVSVEGGIYNVQLGGVTPIPVGIFDGSTRYLGIKVGTDPEMTPRLPMVSVPYAYYATSAESSARLDGRLPAASGSNIVPYTDNSGKLSPSVIPSSVTVESAVTINGISSDRIVQLNPPSPQTTTGEFGISVETTSDTGRAVYGVASGSGTGMNIGGYFVAAGAGGRGVYGWATHNTGINCGGYFKSGSENGKGVIGLGENSSGKNYGGYFVGNGASGYGVYGLASNSSGTNYGGYFEANGGSGYGVYGLASNSIGTNYGGYFEARGSGSSGVFAKGVVYGVEATATSNSGAAVYGAATSESGTNYGGYFEAKGSSGTGVYGLASNSSGENYGGYFRADGASGYGVYGRANDSSGTNYGGYFVGNGASGYGVYGQANGSSGIGVYGRASDSSGTNYGGYFMTNSPSGYAGYFDGGMGVRIPTTTSTPLSQAAAGTMIYNTNDQCLYIRDVNAWRKITTVAP